MLREDLIIHKEEAKEYPLLPKGSYQVEIFDINEVDASGKFGQPGDTNFKIQYIVLDGKDGEKDLRGSMIWDNFIPTRLFISKKNGKCNLYKVVEAVIKKELTREEEMHFEVGKVLNGFIGKQLQVYVVHKPSSDGKTTYVNVMDWSPSQKDGKSLTEEELNNYTKEGDNKVAEPTPVAEGKPTKLSEAGITEDDIKEKDVKVEHPFN